DPDAVACEDAADLRLHALVVALRDEEMRDREPPVERQRRIDPRGRERIGPELARDVGQDPGAIAFTVDRAAAMSEALEPADRLGEDLARRRAILARDGHQRAGGTFVVQGGTLRSGAGSGH